MRNIIRVFVWAATFATGFKAGDWLWDEVLAEKANNLKERFTKKEVEEVSEEE